MPRESSKLRRRDWDAIGLRSILVWETLSIMGELHANVVDNPKDYADNEDARRYDPRLRGPVDEATELSIDTQTGMKNYIANERIRSLRNGDPMCTSGMSCRPE